MLHLHWARLVLALGVNLLSTMTESSSSSDSDSVDLSNVTDKPPFLYCPLSHSTLFFLFRSVNTPAESNQRSARNGGRAPKVRESTGFVSIRVSDHFSTQT